jgi:phospholipid/cholesterol/gamma-HCH transport system substrate-binding protein
MAYGPPPWRKLTAGIIALVAIVAGALAIIAFARVGSLRGDTYRAYILADQASGILKGTDVWLQGQKVGVVKDVGFRSLPTDTVVQTVIEVEVLSQYEPFIRQDSRVEFKPGGTYLGAQVVALRIGSHTAPVLEAGDTLTRVSVIDPEERSNELTEAGEDIPQIVSSLRAIGSDLSKTQTQFGSLGERSSGLRLAMTHVAEFAKRKAGRKSVLSLLASDNALANRASLVITRADSLLRVTRELGTMKRFKADTGLRAALANTRADLDSLRIRISREDGAAGRFVSDDALERDLQNLSEQIARTLADLAKRPERYSPF